MQKGNRVKLLLIPLLVGLVVTLIAHQALRAKAPLSAVAAVDKVDVVVARKALEGRIKLTEEMVTVKEIDREALTGSEFSSVQDVIGLITTVPLAEGEMLLRSKAVEAGKGALPYRIPTGKRAVTIRIDEITGAAGFPDQGDRVDLILFYKPEEAANSVATARLLLEDIPVLVRGPNTGALQPKPEGDVRISSLTLALSPDEAVEVALAEKVGEIKVALRGALADSNRGSVIYAQTRWETSVPPSGGQ